MVKIQSVTSFETSCLKRFVESHCQHKETACQKHNQYGFIVLTPMRAL